MRKAFEFIAFAARVVIRETDWYRMRLHEKKKTESLRE